MRMLIATTLAIAVIATTSPASANCAIVGDSIAAGLRSYFRECRTDAKIGIGTNAVAARVTGRANLIVLSAGSNDYRDPGLLRRLRTLRSRAGAARVIWIRPAPRIAAAAVEAVAHAHGDSVVAFAVSPTDRAHLHPASSRALAADIRRHF